MPTAVKDTSWVTSITVSSPLTREDRFEWSVWARSPHPFSRENVLSALARCSLECSACSVHRSDSWVAVSSRKLVPQPWVQESPRSAWSEIVLPERTLLPSVLEAASLCECSGCLDLT